MDPCAWLLVLFVGGGAPGLGSTVAALQLLRRPDDAQQATDWNVLLTGLLLLVPVGVVVLWVQAFCAWSRI